MIIIRPETSKDIAPIRDVVETAFGQTSEDDSLKLFVKPIL
jgi:predicted N-acetyltransferase YhbS